MDPIKTEKLQAMNEYNKNQFLNKMILYSLTVLTCSLFCSSPFWFPSLCSSIKVFLFVSLPNIGSFFFNPKCLFILGNIIVVFLFGESKLMGSYSSPASDMYDEYINCSRSLQRQSSLEKKKVKEMKFEKYPLIEQSMKRVEVYAEDKEEKGGGGGKEEEDFDGEEELGLPAEELKKKVEDFIARVKKQRRLEDTLLVCSNA